MSDALQQDRARLFTKLYGLAVQMPPRDFLETLADVTALLAEHAPLEEDCPDWQCVTAALRPCLERMHAVSSDDGHNIL
jgi:hypothetical protein